MKTKVCAMRLFPGKEAEYKKRHDEIWPELKKAIRDAGISNYSIYLDKRTNTLFSIQTVADDNTADALPKTDVNQKWWHMMTNVMETHPDESPVADDLELMFHMD